MAGEDFASAQTDVSAAARTLASRSAFIRQVSAGQVPGVNAAKRDYMDPSNHPEIPTQSAAEARAAQLTELNRDRVAAAGTPAPASNELESVPVTPAAPVVRDRGETPQPPRQSEQPPATPRPNLVRVDLGNGEIEMPMEDLVAQARKGRDAQALQEALNVRRQEESFEGVSAAWWKQATPQQRQAVVDVMKGQQPKAEPQMTPFEAEVEGVPAPQATPQPQYARLDPNTEAALRAISQEIVADKQAKQQAILEKQVDERLNRYPLMRDNATLRDIAKNSVAQAWASGRYQDPMVLVDQVVGHYNQVVRSAGSRAAATGAEGGGHAHAPTAVRTQTPPKLTGKDLENGSVRRALFSFLLTQPPRD